MIKLALAGKSKSGKDTTAQLIKELATKELDPTVVVRNYSFASPIKQICKIMFPNVPDEHLYGPSELRESFVFPPPLQPTLLGCDVCGFGTVENVDEWSPILPCRDCGTVALPASMMLTVRQVLMDIGKLGRSYDKDCWSNATISKITLDESEFDPGSINVSIVSDLRFKNEMYLLRRAGFKLVRIYRADLISTSKDVSEVDLDDVGDEEFDFIVRNDKNVEHLKLQLEPILKFIVS
jgi:hypothetical protein